MDDSGVYVADTLQQYIRDIVVCSRNHAHTGLGPSPLGFQAVLYAARIHAVLTGVAYVRPIDIDSVAGACLAHRIDLRHDIPGNINTRAMLRSILGMLVPPK